MSTSVVGAVDVGGTTVKAGILSGARLEPVAASRPTPYGADAVVDVIVDLVAELAASAELAAVGVALPGIVDEATGTGVRSVNLGWREVSFGDLLRDRLDLPVAVGHDVRAGALAEWQVGAGRGCDDLVFVPIGTGIAAGLVLGGRVHPAGGWAGELGHVDVGHDEACACGRRGCLEAIASGAALARRLGDRTARTVAGAAEVAALVRRGDRDAVAVWDEALDALALALDWTITLLAPEVVVLGGGVALAGDDLLRDPLEARLAARLTFQRRPRLVLAELGDRAGCIGAGILARELIGAGR
ncbi:ROK family protein [Nocardioides rotundus]|uniref:ROK family protein n=1 Tax=Nocardioides rotundus TaxID=1774216 RepID=UPI001CBF8B25|nr:ROK family protein [Nocardioides rotundus]UAL28516.1 ROK family protein [Nocardioides rotundus]